MKPLIPYTETLKRETLGYRLIHLKSRLSMRYDITKTTMPAMPKLGKGLECIKLLLSQTSSDMHEPLLPMLAPVLGTKISNAEFLYPSGQWFEMCGQQAALIADSAGNKGQLGLLVEACNRDFRREDKEELDECLARLDNCKGRYIISAPPFAARLQGLQRLLQRHAITCPYCAITHPYCPIRMGY